MTSALITNFNDITCNFGAREHQFALIFRHWLKCTVPNDSEFEIKSSWLIRLVIGVQHRFNFKIFVLDYKMVKVNKCCCFSLETGGYIIGILGIIGSLIVIIFGASLLQIDYDEFVDELFNNIEIDTYPNPQEYYEAKQAFLDIKWRKNWFENLIKSTQLTHTFILVFVAILVVYVVVGSINLIGCICLTVGVNKVWLIILRLDFSKFKCFFFKL